MDHARSNTHQGFDAYTKATVSLSAYSGAIGIRFIGVRGTSYFGDMAIDDISVADPAACAAVQNLSVVDSVTTSSSMTISWDAGDSLATAWEVAYGAPGFATGTGTSIAATATTASITGLSANTAYEFRVRELCVGSSLYSPPTAMGNPKCAPVATWTENFDSYATGSSISNGVFEKWEPLDLFMQHQLHCSLTAELLLSKWFVCFSSNRSSSPTTNQGAERTDWN